MKINILVESLLKLKNEGCEDVTLDPRQFKYTDKYGYLNLRDNEGRLRQKIRITRK